MEQIIKEVLKKITETKKIVVMIGEPKNIHTEFLEVEEYKANKDKYQGDNIILLNEFLTIDELADYYNIAYGEKLEFTNENKALLEKILPSIHFNICDILKVELYKYFNEITDKNNFESKDKLDKHIDALVEEHLKLYSSKEIQDIVKNLLNID